jgi:hypothetical protein
MENDEHFRQYPIDDPGVPDEEVEEWVHESIRRIDVWATHIHNLVDKAKWGQVVNHLELFVRASQQLTGVVVRRFITEEDLKKIIKQRAEMEMGVPVQVEVHDIGVMRGFSVTPQDVEVPDDLSGWNASSAE